jgi:cbb3-type cytochrome oxidase subunit 3
MDQFVSLLAQYGLYLGIPLVFLAVVAWIYRPSAKDRYQANGNILFYGDEEDANKRRGGHLQPPGS